MKVVFRVHALQRMAKRHITHDEVFRVLTDGVVVETYPDDFPFPSRLLLGWSNQRPLHIVAAENHAVEETIVITVYEPDDKKWENGFQERKTR